MKKIAILTFQNAINYGAILQCFALQEFLKSQFSCEVDVINYTPNYFKKVFFDPVNPFSAKGMDNKIKAFIKLIIRHKEMLDQSKKYQSLLRFVNENINLTEIKKKLKEEEYDIYITGSDQIWNLKLLDNDTSYLLDFVEDKKKVSYAASFKIQDVDEFASSSYRKYLKLFDKISVRESNLVDYLKENYQIDSVSVLDPTLLIDNEFWTDNISKERIINEEYILIYFVNPPEELIVRAFSYAKSHQLTIVSLNKLDTKDEYIDYSYASIEEYLNLFFYSNTIFTTSFHGMAFSIIFEKQFFFEVPHKTFNNNDRLKDLASKLGLQNQNLAIAKEDKDIKWDNVRNNLDIYRDFSKKYLSDAIGKDI